MNAPPVWIQIFHIPRLADDAVGRRARASVDDPMRIHLVDPARLGTQDDAAIELEFADALVHHVRGDSAQALAVLDRLSRRELDAAHAVSLARSRAEALLAAGRPSEAAELLRGDTMTLPGCWFATAMLWAGDLVASNTAFAAVEAAAVADPLAEIPLTQIANHAAHLGHFARCERQFERLLALPDRQRASSYDQWRGMASTAAGLACAGMAAARARAWAPGFLARLETLERERAGAR
ncbi:MAG: hypothetical protein IPK74_19970 [Deltaproteobacteria bacterium]|nr:hypothetical protein [Deltaproteobacteria bacterium]